MNREIVDKIKLLLIGIIVFLLILGLYYILYTPVKVGQIWRWDTPYKTPFNVEADNYYKVLEIKKGWVRYNQYYRGGVYENIHSISWFKSGATLIENESEFKEFKEKYKIEI